MLKKRAKHAYILLATIFALSVSIFLGRREWQYFVYGKNEVALFISDEDDTVARRQTRILQYRFDDPVLGRERQESNRYRTHYQPTYTSHQNLKHVFIEYVPGKPGLSRLDGNRRWMNILSTFVFAGFVCWEAVNIFRMKRVDTQSGQPGA